MMIAVNVVGAAMTNLTNGAGEDVLQEWRHAIIKGYSGSHSYKLSETLSYGLLSLVPILFTFAS